METQTPRRNKRRPGGSRPRPNGERKKHSSFKRGGSTGRPRGGKPNRKARVIPTFDPSAFINTNPVEVKEEVYVANNTFSTFGLDEAVAANVAKLGITDPSPIQDQVIPEIMNDNDVIGLAETGTGKTAAFLLPVIDKTIEERERVSLILTPTRELAIQIEEEFRKFSKGLNLYSVTCVGGMNIRPQIRSLKRHNHFIIGTPGRVLDLIRQGHIKTSRVTTVVLDEADRMLDMGFIRDIRSIVGSTPKNRETLFFSATMTDEAKGLVSDFLRDPVTVSVKKKDVTDSIMQDVVRFKEPEKFDTLLGILAKPDTKRVIIFGAMKHSVERLSKDLRTAGVQAESIHGNKTHGQRQRSLQKFKKGEANVLVATDVAARGIHVDNVSHVINYDLPTCFEDYVHRIGRTGRGDKRGIALTFVPARK